MSFSLEPLDEDSNQSSMAKSSSENGSDDESYQPLSQVKIKKLKMKMTIARATKEFPSQRLRGAFLMT